MNKNVGLLQDLRDTMGAERFRTFVERHPGEVIYLPSRGEFVSTGERNAAIRKDFYHGMNVPELADKYGMSTASIYKLTRQRG